MNNEEIGPRREQPLFTMRLYPDEKAALKKNADNAGLSMASFLIRAGLGAEFISRVDLDAAHELLGAAKDMGRLGGLLKLWLSKEGQWWEGDVPRPKEVRKHVKEIVDLQRRMIALVAAMQSRF